MSGENRNPTEFTDSIAARIGGSEGNALAEKRPHANLVMYQKFKLVVALRRFEEEGKTRAHYKAPCSVHRKPSLGTSGQVCIGVLWSTIIITATAFFCHRRQLRHQAYRVRVVGDTLTSRLEAWRAEALSRCSLA